MDAYSTKERLSQMFEEGGKNLLGRLFAFAYHVCGDRNQAEDLVQEAVLRTLERAPEFETERHLVAYLNRVITNLVINEARKARTRKNRVLVEGNGVTVPRPILTQPERAFVDKNLSSPVLRAVASLPERFRDVLLMWGVLDMTYLEIAEVLGIPPGTVMSRLHRARKKVREALREEDASGGQLQYVRKDGSEAS